MRHQHENPDAVAILFARLFENEIRAWNGNARLHIVFWRYGVLTSSILILLYGTTVVLHQLIAEQLLLVLLLPYAVWVLVSIWRCSLATDTLWGLLARFLTIAWAVNVALILIFRQLDLLVLFADNSGAMIN